MELQPVIPFEPLAASELPQGGEWVAQIKWDGVRMLSYCDGRSARLINRRLHDRTLQYPEFADPTAFCSSSSFILDGELIAFDEARPSFQEVMRRDSPRTQASIAAAVSRVPVTYMIFDVLYAEGRWVTDLPLSRRQRLLEDIVLESERVQLCRNFVDASALLELMRARSMEGVVCKNLNSAYAIGQKDGRWRKLKLTRDLYAAIGGVTYNGPTVNALLLGLFDGNGKLHYIGHAGTGKLSRTDWRRLTEQVAPLAVDEMPFANRPDRHQDAVWLAPRLAAKVQFLNWTRGGTMRHPSIQALLPERYLAECVAEQTGADPQMEPTGKR
ncbi:DNA ligase [Cohnella hongkongensis]|uniref:DNA ligase (ATP) n=1 Tax=Cohnella hongkongensis TaxID=178337 RepID=A0ABV9F8R7_9BACL